MTFTWIGFLIFFEWTFITKQNKNYSRMCVSLSSNQR